MNRAVWIARVAAILLLILFTILFRNLHAKLTRVADERAVSESRK